MKIVSPKMRLSSAETTPMTPPDADRTGYQEKILPSLGETLFTSAAEGYRFTYLILNLPEKGQTGENKNARIKSPRSANGQLQTRSKQLMLYVTDPVGQRVRDAQAILSLIDPQGDHQMARLDPWGGGYFCKFKMGGFGRYRLETELVSDCQILTDALLLIADRPADPCCGGIVL